MAEEPETGSPSFGRSSSYTLATAAGRTSRQTSLLDKIIASRKADKYEKESLVDDHGDSALDQEETQEEEKAKPEMVSTKELFRFADRTDKLLMFIGLIAALIHGAAFPMVMYILGLVLNVMITYNNNIATATDFNITSIQNDFEDDIVLYSWAFGGLAFIAFFAGFIQTSSWYYASVRQSHLIRKKFFRAILSQEIGWFDIHKTGELVSRLSDDLLKVQEGLGEQNALMFQWLASAIGGLIIGFVKGPKLAAVILACTPLLAICSAYISKILTGAAKKEQAAYAEAGSVAEEVLSSIRTVAAFGGEDKELQRYTSNLEAARKKGIQKGMTTGVSVGIIYVILFGTYGLAFWYGSKLILDKDMSGGNFLTTFFAVMIAGFALGHSRQSADAMAKGKGAAVVVYKIIDRQSEIDASSTSGHCLDDVHGDLSFNKVKFTYPAREDVSVLSGLSFDVPRGKRIALVGPSGCGKSTVLQLIQRLYDPEEGVVCLDGHELPTLNIAWLRSQIGVVSQEPVLFATSIAENIAAGCKHDVTQHEIEEAAKAANAHNFIIALPQGYETLVGERGSQLSGGQKQRIAIARALVRQPKVLLLDEATSALDTESEGVVQEALDKASQRCTTIIVAHRLSTIRNADLIIALQNGQVAEKGTHSELMAHKGIYFTLVTMQTFLSEGEENRGGADKILEALASAQSAAVQAIGLDISALAQRQLSVEAGSKHGEQLLRQISQQPSDKGTVGVKKQLSKTPGDSTKDSDQPEEEEEEVKPASVGRLLRANSPEWPYMILGTLFAVGFGLTMPLFSIIFSEMLKIFSYTNDRERYEEDASFYSGLFPVLGVCSGFVLFMQIFFFSISGEGLTKRLREQTFQSFLRQDLAFFDNKKNSTGALTTRLSSDAALVQGAAGYKLGQSLQGVTIMAAALVISFTAEYRLTLVILATVPLLVIAGALQMKAITGHANSNKEQLQESGKIAVDSMENIRTVVAFGLEDRRVQAFVDSLAPVYAKSLKESFIYGGMAGFGIGMMFVIYAVSFRFGGYLIANHGVHYGDVFRVFSAMVFSAMSMGQGSSFAPDAAKARHAAARLFKIIETIPSIDIQSDDGLRPKNIAGNVSFEDVHFNYPSRAEVNVLEGVTLSAKEGQTIALVGASGCGKTTSVSLLERFYDVLQGTVRLDSFDVKDLNLRFLRQQLGIVQQEPVLFDASIADNIAYGALFRKVTQHEIEQAAQAANIHSFIMTLPNGYETNVGAKGTQLSGGQKQRVAIARAIVRNPKVLLLDEATSALDTESEKVVQAALDEVQQGRTSIVIAHRLSTIKNAGRIFVIGDGKVLESGTHSELMDLGGAYCKLNRAQLGKK